MRGSRAFIAAALATVLMWPAIGLGELYSFKVVPTPANLTDALIGETQMSMEVTDAGFGRVLFTFRNAGPEASSITDIYVDDGSLLTLAVIHNTTGSVEFSPDPAPPNLPRAQNVVPVFVADASLSADSDSPTQPMGINPYESLGIEYTISAGADFQTVIDELNTGVMRIGIHVQGYDSEGSESFINKTPEPVTAMFLAIGAILTVRRRHSA